MFLRRRAVAAALACAALALLLQPRGARAFSMGPGLSSPCNRRGFCVHGRCTPLKARPRQLLHAAAGGAFLPLRPCPPVAAGPRAPSLGRRRGRDARPARTGRMPATRFAAACATRATGARTHRSLAYYASAACRSATGVALQPPRPCARRGIRCEHKAGCFPPCEHGGRCNVTARPAPLRACPLAWRGRGGGG